MEGLATERAHRAALELVGAEREGDTWIGRAPSWSREIIFGGVLMGQTTFAAARALGAERRVHSLHMYFLRPARASLPVSYTVTPLREGRAFTLARVEGSQQGTAVLTALCSLSADGTGYEYELPIAREAPPPGEVETHFDDWHVSMVGPTEAQEDGTFSSTHRMWIRFAAALPDDPALHAALLAFVTDWTWTGARPLHLGGDTRGIVSLDHSIWFHRQARADAWNFYDLHSLINAGGRGLLRSTLHDEARALCISAAQETILQRYEDAPARD